MVSHTYVLIARARKCMLNHHLVILVTHIIVNENNSASLIQIAHGSADV